MNNLFEKNTNYQTTSKKVDDFYFWQCGWLDTLNNPSTEIKWLLG